MAGHSKWANIKHRKAGQDALRGKLFTKILREISVAARSGGGDPATNPSLRTAIDKGLGANMKRDTIDNAVKKATGTLEGVNYEEVRYEGYGPGGTAVMNSRYAEPVHLAANTSFLLMARRYFCPVSGRPGIGFPLVADITDAACQKKSLGTAGNRPVVVPVKVDSIARF